MEKCLSVIGVLLYFIAVSDASVLNVYINESDLTVHDDQTVPFLVTFTLRDPIKATELIPFPVDVVCEDADLCRVENSPLWVEFNEENRYQYKSVINVTGLFLGHTSLTFKAAEDTNFNGTLSSFHIKVLRNETLQMLNTIFTVFIVIFVTLNTFLMGTQLNFGMIMRAVKKPVGCAIGFGCQYLLMPVVAYITALLVLSGYPSLQFGFFAVGCSPGGGQSNMYTILLGGNIDLSVTMTFFSTAAALAMMPLWLALVGESFYTYSGGIQIPFSMIFSGLVGLIIPSAFGMILIHHKPDWIKPCRTIVKVLSLLMVGVFSWFGLYVNRYVFFLMTWYTLLAGMLLPWCGYIFAFAIATILRQDYKDSITISIETGIQNAGISIILCQFALPQPDADMTVVMPLCVMIFSGLPFLVIIVHRRLRRCFGADEKDRAMVDESLETATIDLDRKKSFDSPQMLSVFEKPVDVLDEQERRFSLTIA